MRRLALFCAFACLGLTGSATAAEVRSGPLVAKTTSKPWHLEFRQPGRAADLIELRAQSDGPSGRLGFRTAAGWQQAVAVVSQRRARRSLTAILRTTEGRRLRVRILAGRRGVVSLKARVLGETADVEAVGIAFRSTSGERYLGFGERSNAVDQRGNTVENFVGEGPYQPGEALAISLFVPPWSIHDRADATYFPMPWLLSTRGFGVLLDNTETSYFRLGSDHPGAWSVETGTPRLSLRVLAGPRPLGALRRLTRITGRQPRPVAPWFLGPWFQTGHDNQEPEEREYATILRQGDAPVSVAETHMRHLPCGGHQGKRASERDRTRWFHSRGFAILTYYQDKICTDYEPAYSRAVAADALIERQSGEDYEYDAYAGDRTPPTAEIAQIDFTAPRAQAFYGSLLRIAIADGYDGWMEDFGEATPPDSRTHSGEPGYLHHNRYPVPFHRAGHRFAERQKRPIARFIRSGWTGVHPYAQVVWGGDPTTSWGFDGLASAVRNGLTMGLSGIGIWRSDIGGFFTLGTANRLDPELLIRWIQFGAMSGVMRTKSEGIEVPDYRRPQIWDPEILPHWRRFAKLRTQLYPYLAGAVAAYRRTGMPMMRHLALTNPRDRRATALEDQYLFGPDLLVAPVLAPGARERDLYLPAGRWLEFWDAVAFNPRTGAYRMRGARSRRGRTGVTVAAPLTRLPMFIRAGALLALLPPDVDTLAGYGRGPELVQLRERRGSLHLLLFPRGDTARRFGYGEWLRSSERGPGWRLTIDGARRRSYRLEVDLGTLRRSFAPCRVMLGRRALPDRAWDLDRRHDVLRARLRTKASALRVLPCRSRV